MIADPAHPAHSNHLISTNGLRAKRIWHHEKPLFEATVEELLSNWGRGVTEQCGFIDTDHELWYVENVHEFPRANFLMDEGATTRTLEKIYASAGRGILGIFHTHPNGVTWPSPRDIVGWPNPRLGWRYFIVTGNDVVEWELTRD